jgi:hypothetical protein
MSNPLADAAIQAGLIPAESLAEMQRWRAPIDIPDEIPEPPKTLEEASEKIRNVLESQGFILTRETDLNILQQYLNTQHSASLHVELPKEAGDEFTTSKADFPVVFGKTKLGEYILPWQGDNLRSEMTNGLTYLHVDGQRIFFNEVREVFYGEFKAFMVCTASSFEYDPVLTENNNG